MGCHRELRNRSEEQTEDTYSTAGNTSAIQIYKLTLVDKEIEGDRSTIIT